MKVFFSWDFKLNFDARKGSGSEADVYIEDHSEFPGKLAIKIWKSNISIEKEVELLMQISHDNIIRIFGKLVDNNQKLIGYIMPYMTNGSLDNIIHDKSKNYDDIYTNKQIKSWTVQICHGLSHLHSKNIIHRDIKPSNILLGESCDEVKLSDLGIARSLENMTHTLTAGRGTLFYMAPEVFEGQEYDLPVDIYSLSITIWEILHRRNPYAHVTNKFGLFSMVCNGERPKMNNDLSKEVSDILKRCWHANASDRPTIDEVLEFCCNTEFQIITLEKLSASNAVSKNAQKPITASKRALNNHESLHPIPVKKQNIPIQEAIEKSFEKQTILLLGGEDESYWDSLLMFENKRENWKHLNIKLPHRMRSHGAQFLNNHLYIFGGQNVSAKPINSTDKLSTNLKWEKMADMNQQRSDISNSNVILNNQIWVCGGYNGNEWLKSVEMYDPLINKWKYMKEMNESRSYAAAAVVNGKIFCSGGWTDSVEWYDPSSDVWTRTCDMPQEISGHGSVEMDGNLIVMGGYGGGKHFNNVWELDTKDKNAVWIEKPSMPIPCGYFSIAKIYDKVFICGGVCGWDNVNIFDGEVWRNGPKIPTPRSCAPAVVIPTSFARSLS